MLDMGDPVETGVSLDAVHKPKMSWSMVILTAIISVLGVFMIAMICKGTSDFSTISLLRKQIIYLMIGFGIMLFIDVYKRQHHMYSGNDHACMRNGLDA